MKGTIHWVSAAHALDAEVRLYDHLFARPRPDDEDDFTAALNPDSLEVLAASKVEGSLRDAAPGDRFQFERQGYFVADTRDSSASRPGLQPHGQPAGHLGEDREGRRLTAAGR